MFVHSRVYEHMYHRQINVSSFPEKRACRLFIRKTIVGKGMSLGILRPRWGANFKMPLLVGLRITYFIKKDLKISQIHN